MAELIRLHLVNPRPAQRYGMHDLLRAYAAEVARAEMPEDDRRAAHTRLNAFYEHTVYSLQDLLFPRGMTQSPAVAAVPMVFGSSMERETWAESERANLVATVVHASRNGMPEYVDAMTFALWLWLYHGGHSTDCLAISNAALHSARQSGNRKAEASALNHAAGALMTLGRYAETAAYAEQSLDLTRQLGDRRGQGRMLSNLAEVYTALGRSRDAKRCGEEGLAIRRTIGSPTVEADGLTALTTLCLNLGLLDEAMSHAAEALAKYDSRKDLPWEHTEALNNLARVQLRLGLVQQADEHLREALAIARPGSHGDKYRAETLILLGTSCLWSGATADAATHLSEALLLARAFGDPELLTLALAGRSRVRLAQGRISDGVSDARDAVAISTDAGHRRCEMIAHNVLGELLCHTEDRAAARRHLDTALAIATEIEDPYEEGLARTQLSRLTA
jgi:tetratricopeptide (TPR) repeat protein